MKTTVNSKTAGKIITRLVFCAVFILLGLMGMLALASMKKPPAEVRHKERPLQVTTQAPRVTT